MHMRVNDSEELRAEAAKFARKLAPRADGAMLVTLSGELGAGKTTFAQGMAKALGILEVVSSPTFVIEKIYALSGQTFKRLIHIDAYRLKGAQELDVLGWKELIAETGNLIVLEWPERVAKAIPAGAIRVRFDIDGDGRIITIDGKENS